jgi:hypothetical protein
VADAVVRSKPVADRPGSLRSIESDFAAIIAPGLHLAFVDRQRVRLDGKTILGELATRDVWVAGPGSYVVLKALAFKSRGANKDAYDLFYVLRYFGAGIDEVVARLVPLLDDASAQEALTVLESDFSNIESLGPRRLGVHDKAPVQEQASEGLARVVAWEDSSTLASTAAQVPCPLRHERFTRMG